MQANREPRKIQNCRLDSMKTRTVTIYNGEEFQVPQGIQRIDTHNTHGWQVRYQGTRFFSDRPGTAAQSLEAATRELLQRIATMPAPTMLQKRPSAHKSSDLPAGISGPILVPARPGSRKRTASAVLSVLLPRYGQPPRVKSIYIGTERTYSDERFERALEKAIQLRAEVEERYEAQATRDRRQKARLLRSELHQARQARRRAPGDGAKAKAGAAPQAGSAAR
jgi:hypothetical protein